MPALLRLVHLPARSVVALLSALLLLLVVLINLPALLVLSLSARGGARSDVLVQQITAWTRALLSPGSLDEDPAPAPAESPVPRARARRR